jgi:hypothetical protein
VVDIKEVGFFFREAEDKAGYKRPVVFPFPFRDAELLGYKKGYSGLYIPSHC